MLSDEAYKQLLEMQTRQLLTKSQGMRLQDWLDLVDEVKNRVPASLDKVDQSDSQTVLQLQKQLKQVWDTFLFMVL